MANPEETAIFIAEVRKDIKYIKEMFDDKCKRYDKHLDDGENVRDRLKEVENIIDTEKGSLHLRIKAVEDILWKIVVSGILIPIVVSILTVAVINLIK